MQSKSLLTAVAIVIAMPLAVLAGATRGRAAQWSVQLERIEAGDSNIAPEFKAAIYENLVIELTRTKRFSAVVRDGDRGAQDVSNLLILKTLVESYHPGSETKRAVTTVAGATNLKIRTQLCTRDGRAIFERVVDGSVRFFGGNLRATHNLARNVAKAVKQEKLPEAADEPLSNVINSIEFIANFHDFTCREKIVPRFRMCACPPAYSRQASAHDQAPAEAIALNLARSD